MIRSSTNYTRYTGTRLSADGSFLNTENSDTFLHEMYRDGVSDPKWRQKIADGVDATTPLNAYTISCVFDPMVIKTDLVNIYHITDSRGWQKEMGLLSDDLHLRPPAKDSVLIASAQAQARTYAFKKLQQLQGFGNNQIFLGEIRETLDLLRHPLEKSVNLVKSLPKSVTSKSSKKVLKSSADSWLEFRFAILPLISDIGNIIDAFNGKQDPIFTKYRFYGKDQKQSITVGPNNLGYWPGDWVTQSLTVTETAETFIRLGIRVDRLNHIELASSRLLSTIDNLSLVPETAWELLPWSFFIDYFVNVGDIISSSVTGTGLVSYTSESNVYSHEYQYKALEFNSAPSGGWGPIIPISPGNLFVKKRSVTRTGGTLAIPPLYFHLPGSNIKYLNIAALAAKFL